MAKQQPPTGEEESLEILRDRTRAWWLSALAGQVEASHPIYGTKIKTTIKEGVLTLSGTVTSEEGHREILSETDQLKQLGVSQIVDELEVVPENSDRKGLLVQTLIGVFDNKDQAGFAQGYLEGHAHVTPDVAKVVVLDGEVERATLRAIVPASWIEDAQKALDAGRALLVVTVDETEAFKTRELLDEETNSLRTLVLPPEPKRHAVEEKRLLHKIPASLESRTVDQEAEQSRQDALKQETAVHEL